MCCSRRPRTGGGRRRCIVGDAPGLRTVPQATPSPHCGRSSGKAPGNGAQRPVVHMEAVAGLGRDGPRERADRKSTRLNSSHLVISYAVFCLKKKKKTYVLQRYAEYKLRF